MIIAQDDDEDYDESGWLAMVDGDNAYLARYSHCSCYGTFESLCGGGISDYFQEGEVTVDWSGTVAQLLDMARTEADPCLPERKISDEDYDADHLKKVYAQVLDHFKETVPSS